MFPEMISNSDKGFTENELQKLETKYGLTRPSAMIGKEYDKDRIHELLGDTGKIISKLAGEKGSLSKKIIKT